MSGVAAPTEKRVVVEVEPRYEVTVGSGLLERIGEFIEEPTVAVISDSSVGPIYIDEVRSPLEAGGRRTVAIEVEAGEASKTLTVLERVLREMAAVGLKRDCAVLALGGGVVSDLAGFAAASYLRGVSYYASPTSLLAMVDASVGGKTGVNLPEGKNLVGAFWQPRGVIADVRTLATLPAAVFREGAVELYKHGLLDDEFLLGAIDEPEFRANGDPAVLTDYVARSVAVKAKVVGADELERGSRAHLNLGHTLAHALEAASSHRLPHGEAVAYGLLFAAFLGTGRGLYDFTEPAVRLLQWLRPTPLPVNDFDLLRPYMARDKKNLAKLQRFVLLRERATPVLADDVSPSEQESAWRRLLEVTS